MRETSFYVVTMIVESFEEGTFVYRLENLSKEEFNKITALHGLDPSNGFDSGEQEEAAEWFFGEYLPDLEPEPLFKRPVIQNIYDGVSAVVHTMVETIKQKN